MRRIILGAALGICLSGRPCFSSSNSQMADDSFHLAAQLYLKNQDQKALEKVTEALALNPAHEPSTKLKTLIEAALQQSSQQDPNAPKGQEGENSKAGQDSGQKDAGAKKQDESTQKGSDQPEDSASRTRPQGEATPAPTSSPPHGDAAQEAPQGTPTPPTRGGSDGSRAKSSEPNQAGTPTPSERLDAAPVSPSPEATPQAGQSESSATEAAAGSATKDDRTMSPEQTKMLLQALTEDELSQLKARPVKIYDEQQTAEDW
jgi:hypothetical protein